MEKHDRIYIAGHNGMTGKALVRRLTAEGYSSLITRTRAELDLTDTCAVNEFFRAEKIDFVFLAAAKVGGILANSTKPVEFLYDNLMIQNNIIKSAYENGVKKICFLSSSCIYPRECAQPMKEDHLLTGPLEPTNEGYALAKISGMKLIEYYRREYGKSGISVIPCNLYGTGDHFDASAHVLSSLVKRFVDAHDDNAPSVTVWGTGKARREFMHVDDAARACVSLMNTYDGDPVNCGWGEDVSIRELAETVRAAVGYTGEIIFDASKPDGMPRKCVDTERIRALGFCPEITFAEGIRRTVEEYRVLKKPAS